MIAPALRPLFWAYFAGAFAVGGFTGRTIIGPLVDRAGRLTWGEDAAAWSDRNFGKPRFDTQHRAVHRDVRAHTND